MFLSCLLTIALIGSWVRLCCSHLHRAAEKILGAGRLFKISLHNFWRAIQEKHPSLTGVLCTGSHPASWQAIWQAKGAVASLPSLAKSRSHVESTPHNAPRDAFGPL